MSPRNKPNQLRIIGGTWRGRKLCFPDLAGLRPSPDRVRETLFNWLAPVIAGARCLDLFAGSGALGLEAASRGAAEVVMVERDRTAADVLREHAARLHAASVEIWEGDVLVYLQGPAVTMDVVFVDPPFGSGLLEPAVQALQNRGWLAPGARVYLESRKRDVIALPDTWDLLRSKTAGQVAYNLAQVRAL